MRIVLPDGYELPENARPGEAFEAIASISPQDDGSFILVAIDGMPMTSEDAEEAEEELSEAQKFAKKIPLPWEGGTEY